MSDKDLNSQLEEAKEKIRSGTDAATSATSTLEKIIISTEREKERYPGPPVGLETRIMGSILEQETTSWRAWWYRHSRAISACCSIMLVFGSLYLLDQQLFSIPEIKEVPKIQSPDIIPNIPYSGSRRINYNDGRVVEATNSILLYTEGSMGGLITLALFMGILVAAITRRFRASIVFFVLFVLMVTIRTFLAG